MDLNYVFLRQQVERTLAEASASKAARNVHEELARAYELQIERMSGGRITFPSHDEGSERLIIGRPSQSGSS